MKSPLKILEESTFKLTDAVETKLCGKCTFCHKECEIKKSIDEVSYQFRRLHEWGFLE